MCVRRLYVGVCVRRLYVSVCVCRLYVSVFVLYVQALRKLSRKVKVSTSKTSLKDGASSSLALPTHAMLVEHKSTVKGACLEEGAVSLMMVGESYDGRWSVHHLPGSTTYQRVVVFTVACWSVWFGRMLTQQTSLISF